MKRLFLIVALIASVFSAQAWTKIVNGASHLIAKKYMTEQAVAEYNRIESLGKTVEYKWVAVKNSKAMLNAELQSVTTDENDIVVRIEKALDLLRNRANHSDVEQYGALVTLQNLLPNLHNVARIGIEGVENSMQDFEFTWTAGKEGSKKHEKRGTLTWSRFWTNNFCFWHQGWDSEYYAYDIDLRFGKQREQMQQGNLRTWAHEMGVQAKPLYEKWQPGCTMNNEHRLIYEDIHLSNVARAGYRLAVLLNDVLK